MVSRNAKISSRPSLPRQTSSELPQIGGNAPDGAVHLPPKETLKASTFLAGHFTFHFPENSQVCAPHSWRVEGIREVGALIAVEKIHCKEIKIFSHYALQACFLKQI